MNNSGATPSFTEADRSALLEIETNVYYLEEFTNIGDINFSALGSHPNKEAILSRPKAKVVCNDVRWSIDALERYFIDRCRSAGTDVFPPQVPDEQKSLGLEFDANEFATRYCFVIYLTDGRLDPIGYSAASVSASVWDDLSVHITFSLDSIFIAPHFTGKGYGASLAAYVGEELAGVYRHLATRLAAEGYILSLTLYSDLVSGGGERCARIVADELIIARDMLIDLDEIPAELLHELSDETGF
ncbi:hypothetical protein FY034_17710 (plasmid) [Trichlorobacter lovleyi]|uniref:hypothetical protein n=1 Tax=Trichlorobacter lovleyi TaxID=313985 RepID=UPI00223ED337|nr:hypothetical protein [Trichlorobacter lovleyi]QOX80861.1 hypothetical protein FY034_17710 [Trichlorobacter lovleyi]